MKRFTLGLILAGFCLSSAALAGSLSDPIVEQDIVATQAAGSSAPGVGLILFLAVVITASTID